MSSRNSKARNRVPVGREAVTLVRLAQGRAQELDEAADRAGGPWGALRLRETAEGALRPAVRSAVVGRSNAELASLVCKLAMMAGAFATELEAAQTDTEDVLAMCEAMG